MRKAVSLDLFLLRRYMRFVELVKSYITNQHPYDVALLDTFGGATFGELDYLNEGRNQDEFNAGFADNSMIYVPKVYWDCTSRKVLTSEWIDGVQLAKSPPDVINALIPTGVECFLAQLLDLGFFHSDPHPGNLLVDQQVQLLRHHFRPGFAVAIRLGGWAVNDGGTPARAQHGANTGDPHWRVVPRTADPRFADVLLGCFLGGKHSSTVSGLPKSLRSGPARSHRFRALCPSRSPGNAQHDRSARAPDGRQCPKAS